MNNIGGFTMSAKLKVYYDGACHLCSREIDVYRKKDSSHKLELIDISLDSFNAQKEGLDPEEVNKAFHTKTPDGKVLSGVDAFLAIWEEIKIFPALSALAKNKFSRKFMDLGYITFAKIRPLLPKRKNCDAGNCNI